MLLNAGGRLTRVRDEEALLDEERHKGQQGGEDAKDGTQVMKGRELWLQHGVGQRAARSRCVSHNMN